MKVGVFVCTYNRPAYLKQCLESLSNAHFPSKTEFLIVDDASTDNSVIEISEKFLESKDEIFEGSIILKDRNRKISHSILKGYEILFKKGCDFVINLDSDAIVKPNFIEEIVKLHKRFPDTIITGFNCRTRNANATERHKVIEEGEGYNRKLSVGGINMAMTKEVFEDYCLPACEQSLERGGNWDHMTCLNLQADGKSVVSVVPSVVQHIGFESSMNHREQPDVADDFKQLYLPNVTIFGLDCLNLGRLQRAFDESEKDIWFKESIILSSIPSRNDKRVRKISRVSSKQAYSHFMIKELDKYINTSHVLVVQYDGYVKNWKAWDDEFLQYDYIGATWWYKDGMNVGNGGFSLRSKKLQTILANDKNIKITHPEDDSICRRYRPYLEKEYGIKFAPESVAKKFSIEGYKQEDKYYNGQFGFHGNHVSFTEPPKKKEIFKDPNNKNLIIINQFFGIGDVLFCIEIARKYIRAGHKVVWAIEPHYLNIAKHFPEINFMDKNLLDIDYSNRKQVDGDGYTIIPLRFSDSIMKVPYKDCMKSKYLMFNMDWKEWRKLENSWVRDSKSEDKLFELLGIKPNERYCVVNMQFTNGGGKSIHLPLNRDMKTVEMSMIPGFSLLDWAKVLEYASEIHTVSTSIIYLLEMINSRATNIHIYKRKPIEKNHDNYSYILTNRHNYILE